jgi:hypothetical protein
MSAPCGVCALRHHRQVIDSHLRELLAAAEKGGTARCPDIRRIMRDYRLTLDDVKTHTSLHLRRSAEAIDVMLAMTPSDPETLPADAN